MPDPRTPPDFDAAARRMDPQGDRSLPEGWDGIETHHQPAKERITIRIDRDVVAYFRAMGVGWQTRANAVLRAFTLSRGMPRRESDGGGVQEFVAQCKRVREVLREAEIEGTTELVTRIVKAVTKPS